MFEQILVGGPDEATAATATSLRVEPAQERSLARIDALLDAAATVVDDLGFDRLSTAQVAELAGASIGTVYRYFPDRIALLVALRDRAVMRYRQAASVAMDKQSPNTWQEVVALLADVFASMFRSEPGFRIMRYEEVGGVEDASASEDHVVSFSERVAEILVASYGFTMNEDLVFRLRIASQMAEALIERAYLREAQGDERMLAEAGIVAIAYLEKYYA